MLSYLSYLLRCAQQSAGSIDVLSTAGADGGEHTVLGQIVAELLHLLVAHSLQRDVGNLMEAYQVEAAVEPLHQPDDGLGVLHAVVQPLEDDVFERESALMREVVVAQQFHHLFYSHSSLCRHQLGTLCRYRVVHGDGHVALALLEESFQLILHAHRTDGDALGAPCPTIVGSQDVRGTEHIVEVVHWLALPHEYDVGQLVHLGQRVYLVEDVACRQTALKPLLSCLTEQAVHLAPHL